MPRLSHTRQFIKEPTALLCALLTFPFTDAFADAIHVTVIQNSITQGNLFPRPPQRERALGGLARRASVVEKLNGEDGSLLVVDSGNLFTDGWAGALRTNPL